jgi:starch-binding outer membrane protein, SusD/RagB family
MKYIFQLFALAVLLLGAVSCSKSKLELDNQVAYSYETYFNSSAAINEATVATYSTLLHNGLWARDYYYIFDMLGYEAKKTSNMQGDLAELADYTFGTNQVQIGHLWQSLYRIIWRSNIVIDRSIAWNPTLPADQAKVKQYMAEAKFLRAYAYFNIVNLWGDAPLIRSYDEVIKDNYLPRSPAASIWAFIEKDLVEAQADLPLSYSAADLGRVTKGAATALLGKSYLYQKKWSLAQQELTKLTQAPYTYTLESNYNNVFSTTNQNSPENIFQVMNGAWTSWGIGNPYYMFGGQETSGGKATHSGRAQEYGFNDWNNLYISTAAVKAFTYPNPVDGASYTDPRANFTFYGDAASGGDTNYCESCPGGAINYPFNAADQKGDYKWKKYEYYDQMKIYPAPISTINGQVIRFADVLLMLAEANIQQGTVTTAPLDLINRVRTRSGAVSYTSLTDKATAMQIIMRERQLELAGEQTRYFDLIRWGIAKQTINTLRGAEATGLEVGLQPFQDKHVLFPIPDVEKNFNPKVAAGVKNDWN